MQMPQADWFSYKLVNPHTGNVRAFEHEVSVHLPWRRHHRDIRPHPASGSPSEIVVGEESRHGRELAVRRVSYESAPGLEMQAEMLGELAEAWAFMKMEMSSRVDPRQG